MKKITLLIVMITMSTGLFAFDGERKGFLLGFGVGGGLSSFTQKIEKGTYEDTSERINKYGVATDFKIGFAPTNRLELYYSSKVS